jgi:hypothetical protein
MTKPTISPAQALLILLKENKQDPELRRWLLSGIEKKEHSTFFERVNASGMLKTYDLSTSDIVITEDPAKRYFETHLSFHTINNMIDAFSLKDLEKYVSDLKGILPEKKPNNSSMLEQLGRAMQGSFEPSREIERGDYTAARGTIGELKTTLGEKATKDPGHLKTNKSYELLQDLEHKIDAHFADLPTSTPSPSKN